MNFIEILFILIFHYIADFVCQIDSVARNKSKSNKVLFKHILLYGLIFVPFAFMFLPFYIAILFLIVNCVLHYTIDYITSRRTSYLNSINKFGSNTVPNFGMFSIIGLDQLLHYVSLFGTYILFKGL